MQNHDNSLKPGSVAVIFGTRPEIVKLAYVIKGLGDAARMVHTGQHYDFSLSASFLDVFGLDEPAHFLGVGGKTRAGQIGAAVTALDTMFASNPPDAVVVQGDTNTTLAGALAANAYEIPIVHVEAGLRSRDRRMPEEHNRVLTDHIADLLCAPTEVGRTNALAEGIEPDRVIVTGNTVVEAVQRLLPDPEGAAALAREFGVEPSAFILSTFHRPENVDDPDRFAEIIRQLAKMPFPVVLPLHPRSRRQAARFGLEDELGSITVIDPIGYREFLGLSAASAFLVSDSGGVQEEVSIYKRPVVVVRRSTERPEVLGTFARLVEPEAINSTVSTWLGDIESVHAHLAGLPSPYGDGTASARIVAAIGELVAGV